MKKIGLCLMPYCLCLALLSAPSYAITITKANPVAAAPVAAGKTDAATSLLPAVLGLATQVMAMNANQKALSAECAPNPAEETFVNNAMKAWASVGQQTADEVRASISGRQACVSSTGNATGYDFDMRMNFGTGGWKPCFNTLESSSDAGNIWYGYPAVGTAKVCTKDHCNPGDEEIVSDIYEIFSKIGFGQDDYTPSEVKMATQILQKQEKCAPDKLTAKQREMWGKFLIDTAGTIGKKQNTGTLMEQIGGIVQQGGGWGQASGIMGVASQFIPQ